MANFFSLPPELRDMIYGYVFDSSTKCVEPVPRSVAYYRKYPKSTSPTGPHCYLRIYDTEQNQNKTKRIEQAEFISLSLLRTCQQIYKETQYLFYKKYTFYFSSPQTMLDTFKVMGLMAQQQIISIHLSVEVQGKFYDGVVRALQSISHLQSYGSLETIKIVFNVK